MILMLPVSIATESSFNLSYDPNGNLIQDSGKYYEYNGFNQLVKIRENSQNGRILEEYTYDYNGDRIEKVSYGENNAATITYYVDENFIRVVNSSGTFDTKFYYNNGQLIARQDPDGKKYYYHPDHLGSTNIVTDQNGNVVEETSYEPFGAVLEGGQSRFLFTGKEKDPTGLYYYGARYYSPSLMKFTQPDTIIQDVYDPQSLNRYAYVRNNPLKYTDPSGHIWQFVLGGLAFLAYYAATTASVWMPQVTAYFAYENTKTIETAINDPTPENIIWAGVAAWDLTTPLVPEGAIAKKSGKAVSDAAKKIFKTADKAKDAKNAAKGSEELVKDFSKNPDFLRKSKQLKEEGEVTVRSFDEANALRRNTFPDAQKMPGAGPKSKVEDIRLFRDYGGKAYHTDYLRDPSTGKIFGHPPDSPHAGIPHINIKDGKTKYDILIDDMAK